MRVAVLGATGPSGRQLVAQALERQHTVVAAVRNPDALAGCHVEYGDKFIVKKIDLESEEDLKEAFDSCDAVLCALGARASFRAINLMTESIPRIVAAMRAKSTKRLIVISSAYTANSPEHPKIVEWILKPLFIGRNLADFDRAERYLLEQSDGLEFTVVKPPQLLNSALNPNELLVKEGQFVPNAWSGVPRANVAKFMLDCLEQGLWINKLVAVAF